MKNWTVLFSTIVGIVFLISGFAKAVDASYFAKIILQYGFIKLQIAAPFVIFAELLLGLLLTFQINVRRNSLIAFIFTIILTLIYTYGLVFKNITDCGCFGHISILNTSPTFTFVRNVILLLLLFLCWKKGDNNFTIDWKLILSFTVVTCVGMFMCGYTFKYTQPISSEKPEPKALSDTPLARLITTSPDSTFLVFVFSYTCPHCLNSIGNLEQFEEFGIADKIIGLAIKDDEAENKFKHDFKPEFEIKNLPKDTIFTITKSLPKSFFVRHDSIQFDITGELPSAYFFTNFEQDTSLK